MLDFDLEFLKGVRMRRTWAEAHTDEVAPFISLPCSEAEILDLIGTKVFQVFFLAIHNHFY